MAPAMSSRIAVWGIGCTLTLLLVTSAQAIDYEVHRHDAVPANGDVILTSRDFLERLNFVTPKSSYTLQEGTEHLLHFGALLRARVLDTFGSLLYDYYDDFGIAEAEALRKVYREILERRYDVFDVVPSVLRNPDTRPSRICARIYSQVTEPCLRSSAGVCRRIGRHDHPHPDDRNTPALNVTYQVYRSSKMSRQYPRGFSLATLLRLLQREALTVTPDLLSGLLFNVRYESYDDDVRLAERELVRHFRGIARTNGIPMLLPTRELRKFHTVNSFLKYYIDVYAETFSDTDLRRHALLIARRIADDIGTIDENIHLLGNVYENRTIHVGYLFDLVLPDDLLENDVVEAKRYLVTKLNEFDVVEKYLRVQKYQQVTPAQLTMEITGQLRDIDFAESIATSLRMHARFWHRSHMIERLDQLLELFDAYENLRQVPRYSHTMQKIDEIRESLQDMKDIPVEILCNAPRACLRMGLQLVLHCQFVSSEIKDFITEFLELSNVCVDPAYTVQESRRSVEIPFKISKVRYSTTVQTGTTLVTKTEPTEWTTISEATTRPSTIEDRDQSEMMDSTESEEVESTEISNETAEEVPTGPETSSGESSESISTTTTTTTPRTTTEPMEPISTIRQEETTAAITSTTTATTTIMLPTTTPSPTTTTTLPTTTTISPATTLSTTTTTMPTTTTTLSTTTTTLPTTTTVLPTTTTTILPTTTTTTTPTTTTTILPTTTTTTTPTTTTTMLPTTTTTTSPTTTTTILPTTTTTTSPTTTTTMLPATTTTVSPTTISTTLSTTTTTLPTTTSTMLPMTTTTISPTTTSTTLPTTTTTTSPTTTTTTSPTVITEVPTIGLEMELARSKVVTKIDEPYRDEGLTTGFLRNLTVFITTTVSSKSCESNECTSEQNSEETSERVETTTLLSTTTPTTPTSTLETTRATSPEPSTTYQDVITSEGTVSSTTELSETPVTKGNDCAKPLCSQGCRSKSESVEISGRSCETSCDSVTEDCDGEDSTPRDSPEVTSPECETEIDGSCGCATKEEKSAECMTLCPSESSSCEGVRSDCATSVMPTIDMNLRRTRTRAMCEIRDPHHRRQLTRLAKMRAISAAAVATSRADVLRPRAPRRRDRIASKKLYKLLSTRSPYSKNRRVADYLRPIGGKLSGKDGASGILRKQREQIYRLRKRLARKYRGKLTRGTTMHRTRRIMPFHQGHIERISGRGARLINA